MSPRLGIFLLLVALTAISFKQTNRPESSVSIGERWQKETLVAEFPFPLYKSEDSLRAERQRVRDRVEPIFYAFSGGRLKTQESVDSIAQELDNIFAAYTNYLTGAKNDSLAAGNTPLMVSLSERTIEDSSRFMELRRQSPIKLSDPVWHRLGWDYARKRSIQTISGAGDLSEPPLFEQILNAVSTRSQSLQAQGVPDIPIDSIRSLYVIVRDTLEQTFDRRLTSEIIGEDEARERIQLWLEESVLREDSLLTQTAINQFINPFFVPSLIYQDGPTEEQRRDAEAGILPARGAVIEGEEIVRNGELVTAEIKQKLDSRERALGSELPESLSRLRILGRVMLALTIIGIFALFLKNARPSVFASLKSVILLSLLYAGTVILFGIVIRLDTVEFIYAVPVVIVSVLLTVIFDSRLALFGTLALALVGGFLLSSDFTYTWATFVGGAVAIFSARGLRNRGQLFLTAAYAFGGYALALCTIWLFQGGVWSQIQDYLLFAGMGSFLLVTASPFLWILERVFDITTDLRLLELSDTNHPLLKELVKHAPGTSNHSIQVSSLAGSVADAVNANSLLTRVGALYHDVGKLSSPEYFIENQSDQINPHNDLDPEESAKIIISHVTKGLELGERYRLPSKVLHLIASHHGTTRTEYFYQRALDQAKTSGKDFHEDVFRYPGPRPNSKEAGILMLTDTVEAASRTLQEVTGPKIQQLVDELINQKVSSGQLDDTGLTFRDISQTKKVLLEQLLAIHHVRLSYPKSSNSTGSS